jgi:hypothetical protein
MATMTTADLPAGSDDLYIVSHGEADIGIGTPDELRDLIAEGVIPSDGLRFRLEPSFL